MTRKRRTTNSRRTKRGRSARSRNAVLQRLQRRLLWVTLLLAGLAALLVWAGGENGRAARWLDDWLNEPHRMAVAAGHRVGIVAGHMGYDSGALCEDGLTEAEVVAEIAQRVVQRLRRAGASVDLLAEYDDRLNGYAADVLVSIHADSCQVERSGFKVVHAQPSAIPAAEDRLVACLRQHYADITGLAFDEATITAGMTEYHAFKRVSPSTAAAIIETGFLSGDRELLSLQPDLVARGIVDGVICYLEDR